MYFNCGDTCNQSITVPGSKFKMSFNRENLIGIYGDSKSEEMFILDIVR